MSVAPAVRRRSRPACQQAGRWVLASACAAGWLLSLLLSPPPHVLALTVAFVSGAVIVNSSIMELPLENDGRFMPFLAGGAAVRHGMDPFVMNTL